MIDGWFLRSRVLDRALRRLEPEDVVVLLRGLVLGSREGLALYDQAVGPVPLDELEPDAQAAWDAAVSRRLAILDEADDLVARLAPLVRGVVPVVPARLRQRFARLLEQAAHASEGDAWLLLEAVTSPPRRANGPRLGGSS